MRCGHFAFTARLDQHLPAIVAFERDRVWAIWRKQFRIPLNDPRARTVTMAQALLDLELLIERDRESEENADWLDEVTVQAKARKDALPTPVPDLPGAPSVEDGNTNKEAALERLRALAQVTRKDLQPVPDDVEYEVVDPYEFE